MEAIDCIHEDGQILFGTQLEAWNDDEGNYALISEQWHKPSDYYNADEVDTQIIALTLQD